MCSNQDIKHTLNSGEQGTYENLMGDVVESNTKEKSSLEVLQLLEV